LDQENEIISFAEHVSSTGGSGFIYGSECEKILKGDTGKNLVYVDEFIAPIVHQIIVDAAEVHPSLYKKIMGVMIEAYSELQLVLAPEVDPPKLIRIK
jgi:hypothetical protein